MDFGLGERFRLLAAAFASRMKAAVRAEGPAVHPEGAATRAAVPSRCQGAPDQASAWDAFRHQHRRNRREHWVYRLLDRPLFLPLSSLIEWVDWLNGLMLTEGLARAGAAALERLNITLTVDIPEETRRLLQRGDGLLLVGDHPEFGGLDLLAVSAALSSLLPGDTLRFQGLFLLAGLGQGFARHLFPVFISTAASDRIEQRRQLYTRQAGPPAAAIKALMPPMTAAEAARRTRAALHELCTHWLTGGQVIVFPGGGGGAGAPWYPTVGRILLAATDHPVARPETYPPDAPIANPRSVLGNGRPTPAVVFFHVRGASTWLLARPPLLHSCHPIRILASRHRPQLRVFLSSPFSVRSEASGQAASPQAASTGTASGQAAPGQASSPQAASTGTASGEADSKRTVTGPRGSRHDVCARALEASYRAWLRSLPKGEA